MKLPGLISVARVEIIALLLLAAVELNLFDVFSKYVSPSGVQNDAFFLLLSFFIAVLSLTMLHMAVTKLRFDPAGKKIGEIHSGAAIGFISSVCISLMLLIFAYFGFGVDKAVSDSLPASSVAINAKFSSYALLCLAIVISYTVAGIMIGSLSIFFVRDPIK